MNAPAEGTVHEPRARAEAFLAGACGAARVVIERWERLSGGAIQENVALDVVVDGGPHAGRQAWVLRTDAPSAVSVSHTRPEEFEILRAAHGAGVRVPEPLFLCSDGRGPDFFVMRRVPASPPAIASRRTTPSCPTARRSRANWARTSRGCTA